MTSKLDFTLYTLSTLDVTHVINCQSLRDTTRRIKSIKAVETTKQRKIATGQFPDGTRVLAVFLCAFFTGCCPSYSTNSPHPPIWDTVPSHYCILSDIQIATVQVISIDKLECYESHYVPQISVQNL